MRQGTIGRLVLATLVVGLATSAAAIDLSGDYVGTAGPIPCRTTWVQAGTTIQTFGSCFIGETPYALSLTGSVDPDTGAFTATGELTGLCADVVVSGAGDGEETHGTYTSSTPLCGGSGSVFATKCSNGVVDPGEDCEDGNILDGDCCSSRCRMEAAGSSCTGDGESCTNDVCDASGTCTHVPASHPCDDRNACTVGDACVGGMCSPGSPASAGQTCESDFDPCTADVCDTSGTCTHVPVSAGACRRAVACHSTCTQELAACKRTCPAHGRARRDCRAACADASTCTAPGAPIRTLAYVVTECSQDPQGLYASRQRLLVRRGNCDPITVKELDEGPPSLDPRKFCPLLGGSRWGELSTAAGLFQRVTVLPDGSGVVYEVTHQFSLSPNPAPPDAEEGFFFVRPDGTGTRRLGDPSRLPLPQRTGSTIGFFHDSAPISPDGRTMAVGDIGQDSAGHDSPQLFRIDLQDGTRRQVTHEPGRDRCCQLFLDNHTLTYHWQGRAFEVTSDGQETEITPPVAVDADGTIRPQIDVTNPPRQLLYVGFPRKGPPSNGPISEVFLIDHERSMQLTEFGRSDTFSFGGFIAGDRAFLSASVNRQAQNPIEGCQLFSKGIFSGGLRQLTHLRSNDGPVTGCNTPTKETFLLGQPVPSMGCGISRFVGDPVTGAVLFSSSCDPLGSNPFGEQIFAMRPDGTGLRQLTRARGMTTDPDGTVHVEIPGPFAYTARDTR